MSAGDRLPEPEARRPPRAMVTAILSISLVGLVGVVLGFVADPSRTLFGYLVAWIFATTTALGALILLMIGHASKASWMVVTRRLVEPMAAALPLLFVLALPLALGLGRIYPWAAPTIGLSAEVRWAIVHKQNYLNPPFFLVRSACYFGVFIAVGALLRRWSRANDKTPTFARVLAMRRLSGGALPVVALALTWASFDWVMSLEPDWSSSIFGLYFFSGGFISAVAIVCILQLLPTQKNGVGAGAQPTPDHAHAMGRVLFAMVIFWAYMAFSQLLIQWIADLPDEIVYYQLRTTGSWSIVSYGLVVGHFFLPFFALLPRRSKRNLETLALIGGLLAVMHYVDVSWMILPIRDPQGVRPHWVDAASLLFVGGAYAAVFAWQYYGAPPLPLHAPELKEGLDYEAAS